MQNMDGQNCLDTSHTQHPFSYQGQKRKYKRYCKKYNTYVGLIAFVIQGSPNKMLTFSELMNKLERFVSGDRKGFENVIRVCLSSNSCFIKIPINPECPNAKRNFWKVDENRITPKMFRRHFRGMLDMFPELSSKMKAESLFKEGPEYQKAKGTALDHRHAIKFTSPFSIESLLQRDSNPPPSPKSAQTLEFLPQAQRVFHSLSNEGNCSALKGRVWVRQVEGQTGSTDTFQTGNVKEAAGFLSPNYGAVITEQLKGQFIPDPTYLWHHTHTHDVPLDHFLRFPGYGLVAQPFRM